MSKEILLDNIKKKHNVEEVKNILSDIVKHLIISDFGYVKTLGTQEVFKYLIDEGIDLQDLESLNTEKDYEAFFDKVLSEKIEGVNNNGLESQIDFIMSSGISAENIEMMISI